MKRALITGITGQDGSYLAEFLLSKGYEVHGMVRRASSSFSQLSRIQGIFAHPDQCNRLSLHQGDLSDANSLERICELAQPHEIYHLAAMSDVKASFEMPEYTTEVNFLGTLKWLEILRCRYPNTKFYQASSSEIFGNAKVVPQNEDTLHYPRSPYGLSKLAAYWAVVHYREAYGLHACNGILFNHESPRRGENFISRKVTLAVARIASGKQESLIVGNLDAERDWGFAADYVEGMWLMVQFDRPGDFVLATGRSTSVRELVTMAFKEVAIELMWEGRNFEERGIDVSTGKVLVQVSPDLFRPTEVYRLLGDASKAQAQLGWKPSTSFEELIRLMVYSDLQLVNTLQNEVSVSHQTQLNF